MGQHFRHLRTSPWNPTFKWAEAISEAAEIINRPHEDYPMRIPTTHLAIEAKVLPIDIKSLLKIHKGVFGNTPHGGKLRTVNVRIGSHIAPQHSQISALMEELYDVHSPLIPIGILEHTFSPQARTEKALIDWYTDFETIHPFQDGNGRVGGIVVAQYSHLWVPERGWLAAQQ